MRFRKVAWCAVSPPLSQPSVRAVHVAAIHTQPRRRRLLLIIPIPFPYPPNPIPATSPTPAPRRKNSSRSRTCGRSSTSSAATRSGAPTPRLCWTGTPRTPRAASSSRGRAPRTTRCGPCRAVAGRCLSACLFFKAWSLDVWVWTTGALLSVFLPFGALGRMDVWVGTGLVTAPPRQTPTSHPHRRTRPSTRRSSPAPTRR